MLGYYFSYEHSSGREAVLEMLHAIIKKFPQTKLDEQSHTLFVHLVARLANDHDNKVRSMTGVAIKLLIERINPHMLHSILEYSLSWYLGTKQQLWSAGAQVKVSYLYCKLFIINGICSLLNTHMHRCDVTCNHFKGVLTSQFGMQTHTHTCKCDVHTPVSRDCLLISLGLLA